MKVFHLLFFIMFLSGFKIYGCTIIPETFCQTIDIFKDNLIVSGEIVSIDNDGLYLEIIEVLRGQESKDIIRIWDGTDFDCNGIWSMSVTSIGSLNDTVIISLPQISEIANVWDVIGDYRRPDPYYYTSDLRIENGFAIGLIYGHATAPPEFNTLSIEYDKLIQTIISDDNCSDLISSSKDIERVELLKFNNPINSRLKVQINDPANVNDITIYSIRGRIIYNEKTKNQPIIEFDFTKEISGIYILEVKLVNNISKFYKLVKS